MNEGQATALSGWPDQGENRQHSESGHGKPEHAAPHIESAVQVSSVHRRLERFDGRYRMVSACWFTLRHQQSNTTERMS